VKTGRLAEKSFFFWKFPSNSPETLLKRTLFALLFIPFIIACESSKFESEVVLPNLFSTGMVFQRDQKISTWGKGIPGKKVRVSLAEIIASTEVEPDSTWSIKLPSLPAGGPYTLQVNKTVIEDVYVGDVWLAGGQSNMEWPLKSEVIGAEAEFAEGGFPAIRFFKVPNSYSAIPQKEVKGGEWKVADSINLKEFSAVAWFFAKRNHLEKNVPVGIIESNWGGTPAEGWTDAKVLAEMEKSFSTEAKEILENQEKWEQENLTNEMNRNLRDSLVQKPDSLAAIEVSSLDYNDTGWRSIDLPKANPLQHIAWIRKKFDLTSTEDVTLHLPNIDQIAFIYLNGKQLHYKDWGAAMPDLKVSPEMLLTGKNVLTIRAINTWNNQPQVGATDEMYFLQNGKKISLEGKWTYSNNVVEPMLPEIKWNNWRPGMMYNAMIAPLTKFPIMGAIWYQGESNAGKHEEYKELFSTMITSWRAAWGIGDFPFLFVQLANFMERQEVQPESDWAFLREAQAQTLDLPNTGMAVIIEIGEEADIHPKNKKDVGERLWLQARKVAFGEKTLASGPIFKTATKTAEEILIAFSEVGEGLKLTAGDKVKGFIISDSKGKFHTAEGEILGKDQVKIILPEGMEPSELRYAWADNPEVNLINSIDLPAAPFRFSF
jgi:sialate O-acetylesterase